MFSKALVPVAFLFASVVSAAELSGDQVRQVVQQFLDTTETYQADFYQQVRDDSGDLVEEGAGQFWLKRPGQLRWHYDQPWERDIAASKTQIAMYDAELEQLTVRGASGALAATPAALLVGDVGVLDNYHLSGATSPDAGAEELDDATVKLVPVAANSDFKEVSLVFAKGLLRELLLADRFGQLTRIEFSTIEVNAVIDDAVFELDVPDTTDVIDEREI